MFIKLNLILKRFVDPSKHYSLKILCRHSSISGNSNILSLLTAMPRPLDKHISEAQKQRKLVKERGLKYVPGTVHLQVLGSGSKGSPKSVYLFTDQSRYLFNCGEGTQRLSHEHKMKLARLEHVFLTTANWDSMGGLPGISLTLQDVGVPMITLHGPPGLDELFTATGRFVLLKDMKIEMAQCDGSADFEDSVMTVKYVPLVRSDNKNLAQSNDHSEYSELLSDRNDDSCNTVQIEADNTDYYAHEYTGKRMVIDNDIENLLKAPRKEHVCSMAYICRLKACPGILDLQKCVNMGVKPGPMLGVLKNGQDVKLDDGSIIYAKDVRTPDDPGPVFIVLGIPDVEFLDTLAVADDFKLHQENPDINPDNRPAIIVHFTPSEVLNHEKYQEFMKTFSPNTYHLIVNDENSCSGSVAVHRTQHKLHILDKNIFPIIKDTGIPIENKPQQQLGQKKIDLIELMEKKRQPRYIARDTVNIDLGNVSSSVPDNVGGCINAKTFTTFHLRPKKGLDSSLELKLDINEYITETMNSEGFPESLEELHKVVSVAQQQTEEYPKIVFFGTGSCIPNKTRNTSGIMVHTDHDQSILMDCGEGTYSQMCRFYGREHVGEVLCNLKAIYLSHLHADHHLGLIGVLQARRKALNELKSQKHEQNDSIAKVNNKLYVMAPKQIMSWLVLYDQRFERILQEFQLVSNQSLVKGPESNLPLISDSILESLGVTNFETCPVRHCPNSFGITITTKQSKKITYSGDTMPSDCLVDIGNNSDLLIHEATMEDDLINEARRKMHSTAGQAVLVGKRMNAKFTLLTHFSQRYARIPRLSPHLEKNAQTVGVAFDFMQVSLNELWKLPHFFKPLKLMFSEHCEGLEFKAVKRAMRRLRGLSPPTKVAGTSKAFSTIASTTELKNNQNENNTMEVDTSQSN